MRPGTRALSSALPGREKLPIAVKQFYPPRLVIIFRQSFTVFLGNLLCKMLETFTLQNLGYSNRAAEISPQMIRQHHGNQGIETKRYKTRIGGNRRDRMTGNLRAFRLQVGR